MIAVIFEVWPLEERRADYLAMAGRLRGDLEQLDGFISVERFQSITDPAKMLSLSIWRDEAAVAAWRTLFAHRKAQTVGRAGMFRDYRIRVASVLRDYDMTGHREEVPADIRG